MAGDDFLSRWSRRKLQAKAQSAAPAPAEDSAASPPPAPSPAPSSPEPASAASTSAPLPPVESLTADSDFAPFMQPGVDEVLKRTALKKLLHDPRFNVMDGLDVYIDDYSKPDPLPEGWLEKMTQMTRLGDYPAAQEAEDAARAAKVAAKEPQDQAVEAPRSARPTDTAGAGSPAPELPE